MIYTVRDITLRGKEKLIEQRARISLDKLGLFLVLDADGENVIMEASRGRVESVHANGLVISCMVGAGVTRSGVRLYEYREFYCAYEAAKKT